MYLLLFTAATALLLWNASPLWVALLRISYGKFTWALPLRLALAFAAALLLRLAAAQAAWMPEAALHFMAPAAVLLSLAVPFAVEWWRAR